MREAPARHSWQRFEVHAIHGNAKNGLSPNRALVTYGFMYTIDVEQRSSPPDLMQRLVRQNVKDRKPESFILPFSAWAVGTEF